MSKGILKELQEQIDKLKELGGYAAHIYGGPDLYFKKLFLQEQIYKLEEQGCNLYDSRQPKGENK